MTDIETREIARQQRYAYKLLNQLHGIIPQHKATDLTMRLSSPILDLPEIEEIITELANWRIQTATKEQTNV